MENKKAQLLTLTGGFGLMIVIGIIILIIILAAGSLISFLYSHLYTILGGSLILLALIFGLRGEQNKSKEKLTLFFIGCGILLLILSFSGVLQTQAEGPYMQGYFESPFFGTIKCEPVNEKISSGYIPVGDSGQFFNCPINSDQCDIDAYHGTYSCMPLSGCHRITYGTCSSGNLASCQLQKLDIPCSKGINPLNIKTNLIKGQYVYIKFEKASTCGLMGWNNDNDGKIQINFVPYGLSIQNSLGGGYDIISETDCKIPSSFDKSNLILSASVKDTAGKLVNPISQLPDSLSVHQYYNFIAGTVTRATFGNAVNYNGEQGYCANNIQGGQVIIYKIGKITTPRYSYNIVDLNNPLVNLGSSQDNCCNEGEQQLNRVCQNFKWKTIQVNPDTGNTNVECDLNKNIQCNPGRFVLNSNDKTTNTFKCINNKCVVSDIQKEECVNTEADCDKNEVCINYKCQTASSEIDKLGANKTKLNTKENCLDRNVNGYRYEWVDVSSEDCGFWCSVGLKQPTIIQSGYCKDTHQIYMIIGIIGGIVFLLFITYISTNKSNKRRK